MHDPLTEFFSLSCRRIYRNEVLLKMSIRSSGLKVEHKKGLGGHIFRTFLVTLFYRIDKQHSPSHAQAQGDDILQKHEY